MKNRTNRHWIAFIFLVLLSGLILSGCGGGQPKTEEPARAPDEHTALYLGTWTADVIQMKTKNEKERTFFYIHSQIDDCTFFVLICMFLSVPLCFL